MCQAAVASVERKTRVSFISLSLSLSLFVSRDPQFYKNTSKITDNYRTGASTHITWFLHVYNRNCTQTVTRGDYPWSPNLLAQQNFYSAGQTTLPFVGTVVDVYVARLPDTPTARNATVTVDVVPGTAQLALYEFDRVNSVGARLTDTTLFTTYRKMEEAEWPELFFSTGCPF